jgi:hypothetical protein
MSQVLEEIKRIILSSDLDPADQNDLLVFLPVLPEDLINDLCKIFQKDSEKLREFNENFKSKIKALIGGREDELDELFRKEAEEAGELEKEEEEEVPGPDELEKKEEENY